MLSATWITVLHLIATFLGVLLKNVRIGNLSFDIYLKNHNVTVFKCQTRIKLYSYLYKYQMNGCFLWYLGFWKGKDQVRWQRLVLQYSKAIPHTLFWDQLPWVLKTVTEEQNLSEAAVPVANIELYPYFLLQILLVHDVIWGREMNSGMPLSRWALKPLN